MNNLKSDSLLKYNRGKTTFKQNPVLLKGIAELMVQEVCKRILGEEEKKWESRDGIYLYQADRAVKNFIS